MQQTTHQFKQQLTACNFTYLMHYNILTFWIDCHFQRSHHKICNRLLLKFSPEFIWSENL